MGYVQQNPGNTWVFPCFLYRPTHAPTDAEIERQSQDKRPQGLDTGTSPSSKFPEAMVFESLECYDVSLR